MKNAFLELVARTLLAAAVIAVANTATAGPARSVSVSSAESTSDLASRLMDFAQTQFPQYFPSAQPNQSADSWVYRYYPETGAYLIVDGQKIFVAGPPFGNGVIYVGVISQFIATDTAPLITASQLAKCPDGTYTSSDFYNCMVGRLEGAQVFDSTQACTLSIKADGTIDFASGATAFQIGLPYQNVSYRKRATAGDFSVNLSRTVGTSQVDSLSIAVNDTTSSAFFTSGGALKVEARRTPAGTSLSCMFDVAQ